MDNDQCCYKKRDEIFFVAEESFNNILWTGNLATVSDDLLSFSNSFSALIAGPLRYFKTAMVLGLPLKWSSSHLGVSGIQVAIIIYMSITAKGNTAKW